MGDSNKQPDTYRRPPAEAEASAVTPRQGLTRGELPVVGGYALSLGLGAPLRVSLDRERLQVSPGSGVHLELDAPVAPVHLRGLAVDLTCCALRLDGDGLGPFADAFGTLVLEEATARLVEMITGSGAGATSPVADFLDGCPEDQLGRRELWAQELPLRTSASLWVDPGARVELVADGARVELTASAPLVLKTPLATLELISARLSWSGRVELTRAPGGFWLARAWRATIVAFALWLVHRWLRDKLPEVMRAPGYDLAADPARAATLQALWVALSSGPKDSPKERAASPLAELLSLRGLTAAAVPEGARALVTIPVGDGRALALCTDADEDLTVAREGQALTLATARHVGGPGHGLFVHVDALPGLARLRLAKATLSLVDRGLSITTTPALGPCLHGLVAHVGGAMVGPRLPDALVDRLGADVGERPLTVHRQPLPGGGAIILSLGAATRAALRLDGPRVALHLYPPLSIRGEGLGFPARLLITGVELDRDRACASLQTTPPAGALEDALLTALTRTLALPRAPAILGLATPPPATVDEEPVAVTHAHAIHELSTPLGPVTLRMAVGDRLAVTASAVDVRVTSVAGLIVDAPGLGLILRIEGARVDLKTGAVDLVMEPAPGPAIVEPLARALAARVLPLLRARLPAAPAAADAPWVLARVNTQALGAVEVTLPPRAAVIVERDSKGMSIKTSEGVRVTAARDDLVAPIVIRGARWDLPADRFTLHTAPEAGPAVQALVAGLAPRLTAGKAGTWLAEIARRLALPKPKPAGPPPPPPKRGALVWQRELPLLGRLRATLPAVHALTLSLDRARAAVDLGDGAVLRAPAINYQLTVQRARLQFSPRSLDVDVTPALGELERSALARALGDLLDHQLRDFWPEDQDGIAGADTLLVLGRDAPWGPLRVCVPTGGALALRLTHEGVAVTSAAGVLFVATKLDWLPSFRLRRLEYQFQSGAVAIDITGIEERFYKEDQDVSVVTEAILAHLIKLLVDPKIPDLALPLGFVRHEPPPALKPPFGRIKLFNHELSPTIGVLTLTMDPDDAITIGASGEEVSITTERGLQVHLPALRLQVELKRMRFHPVSGEVQLGGLGQLENAVVEAIIARKLAERRAGAGAAEAEAQAPIDVALASVPRDSDGRLVLYKSGPVDIKMDPSARFEITFAPTGIDFKADPPISIDGPGFLDAEVAGVRYNFADATFKIKLASDGVLPDFLSGKAVVSIEKKIAAVFAPLLPPIMRERGYSLADDIMPAETLAELIGALRRFGKQSPKP